MMRLLAIAFTAILLLCAGDARAQSLTKITIGSPASDEATPILYAIQSGAFRRAGLDVELQKMTSGAAGMAAVVGGSLSIAGTNSLSLILAHLHGVPFVMVAPGGIYNSTTDFVAAVTKPSNPIRSGRDLNNKVVGVGSVGDLNAIALLAWVDANGGDSKTVKQVEIPYAAIPAALTENRIEVSTLLQPVLSQAVDAGSVRIFAKTYDGIAPRFLITEWITTTAFSNANAEAMRRFARVMRNAEAYSNGHRPETASLLAAFSGVDAQQITKGGRDTFAATILDPKDVQPVIDAAVRYGVIDHRFDAAEMLSPAIRSI